MMKNALPRIAAAMLLMVMTVPAYAIEQLSLQEAVGLALKNNPTISAGQFSAMAAKQAAQGARALVNPELFVAPSVLGDAGSDSAVFFSQPLEINGTRRVRGEIASSEAAAANCDADALRRDILLRVNQSYWDVVRAQEQAKLNEENLAYLESIRDAVQKQFDVGAAPGAQTIKIDVELARARQELAQAQLALSQSRSELNNFMGCPTGSIYVVSEPLVFYEGSYNRDTLQTSALSNRPEIASAREQFTAVQGQIKAAKLLRVPDLALQARRESFDKESDGGVAIAVNLPLLDWGSFKAERRRAQAAAQSQEKQLEAVQNRVSLEVEQAWQRVCTASQVVREYRCGVLAKSEELAAMARKGYEKGASSYLDVLEAQRTLRSVRSDYYSALTEHAKALAQLEWAAGCTILRSVNPEVKK